MTPADIKNAPVGATLYDDQVKGLQMRVFNGKRAWYFYYRIAGQQRRPKIGEWPTIPLADARTLARELALKVARGEDPSRKRQEDRVAPTMRDLWAAFAKVHSRKKTAAEDRRLWEKHLAAGLATKRAGDVALGDVQQLHASLSDTPVQANRVLALLSTMLNYAEALGWRPSGSNPCRHVKRYKEMKRRRHMTPTEARRIADVLETYRATHPEAVLFVYLLILTGARKSEIAKARRSHVEGNKLVLLDHKTDGDGLPRVVFLPDVVVALLPTEGDALVRIQDPKKLWAKVRVEAGCPDLRLQDLRRSFASAALSAGLPLSQVGELLGHRSPTTTKRYAYLMDDPAVQAANATAAALTGMMGR